MTRDDFDRGLGIQEGNEVMGFRFYKQFVAHQNQVINNFNETSIGTMEFLRDNGQRKHGHLVWKGFASTSKTRSFFP